MGASLSGRPRCRRRPSEPGRAAAQNRSRLRRPRHLCVDCVEERQGGQQVLTRGAPRGSGPRHLLHPGGWRDPPRYGSAGCSRPSSSPIMANLGAPSGSWDAFDKPRDEDRTALEVGHRGPGPPGAQRGSPAAPGTPGWRRPPRRQPRGRAGGNARATQGSTVVPIDAEDVCLVHAQASVAAMPAFTMP